MADLTRPIIGIENRTAQEVFDIMADRLLVTSQLVEKATAAESTISSLSGEVERLKALLAPFAAHVVKISQAHLSGHTHDDDLIYVRYGDLRAAHESLSAQKGDHPDAE